MPQLPEPVRCTVERTDLPGDDKSIPGLRVTCQLCGHVTESFGQRGRSLKRCLSALRNECPREANNLYATAHETELKMDRYERTMREERWIIAEELFARDRPEPAEVVAFRILQEQDWMHFIESIQGNPTLKFFNVELGEFSGAKDWKALSDEYDIEPFADELAISPDMLPVAQDFCRQLRMEMRWVKEEGCGGCKAFYTPEEWLDGGRGPSIAPGVVLVVCHDGGNMAPRFNIDYERTVLYDRVDLFLDHRNLWRETQTSTITHIFKQE